MSTPADYVRTTLRIQREQLTGILRVRSDSAEVQISFQKGQAVWATGDSIADSLGRLLLEDHEITDDDYANAMETLSEGDAPPDEMQLAHTLLQAGKLTGEGVTQALTRQVRRRLERPLSFNQLTMAFNPLDQLPPGTHKFPCGRIERCVLSGTRRHFGPRGAKHYLGGLSDSYMALRDSPAVVAERYGMNTHEARFLANLNGAVHTRLLLRHADDFDPHVLVAALVLAAELTLSKQRHDGDAPPQSSPSPRVPSHPAPPARTSEPGPISQRQARPGRLPSTGHRSQHPGSDPPVSRPSHISSSPPSGPISTRPIPRARISQVSVDNAEVPGPPSIRPAPRHAEGAAMNRVEAEKAFQRGLRHIRAEQWAPATDELGRAAAAMPDETEYQLYSVWASYRVCTIDEERSVLRLELENLARTLAKVDRKHGFPPYVLGHLSLTAEDVERALKLFKMAVVRDPKNRDAERHVRLLESRIQAAAAREEKRR